MGEYFNLLLDSGAGSPVQLNFGDCFLSVPVSFRTRIPDLANDLAHDLTQLYDHDRGILVKSVKFMERADNLPVNWDFQNNVIHTLPLISAFANAILWPPRLDNLTRKMALLTQLVYFSGTRSKTTV